MIEQAGKLMNGLPIATVNDEKKEITIIVPVGFEVNLVAVHSGCDLANFGSQINDRGTVFRNIRCVEVVPPPTIVNPTSAPDGKCSYCGHPKGSALCQRQHP